MLLGPPLMGGGGSSDETLGGLPNLGPGGGQPLRLWPEFYLEGPVELVALAVLEKHGRYAESVTETSPGAVRLAFRGVYRLVLDEAVLDDPRLTIGVGASEHAGTACYALLTADGSTPVFSLAEGASLELPWARIRARGMFDSLVTMVLAARQGGRHAIEFERHAGRFLVEQTY